MADLHRAGVKLRKPPIYKRVGIPGSGGPDWLRADAEWIVCSSKGKLPWSDNTATGKPCVYGPGGKPSHRLADGSRVSGKLQTRRKADGERKRDGIYKPPKIANPGNVIDCSWSETKAVLFLQRYCDETLRDASEVVRELQRAISSEAVFKWCLGAAQIIHGASLLRSEMHGRIESGSLRDSEGESQGEIPRSADNTCGGLQKLRDGQGSYSPSLRREPTEQRRKQHPGSLPSLPQQLTQSSTQSSMHDLWGEESFKRIVREALPPMEAAWRSTCQVSEHAIRDSRKSSDIIECKAGGGAMGSKLAHENEAPFPEKLAEAFVLSFCPPGGTVVDPFCGSGTTLSVAHRHGRNYIGVDVRQSQVDLSRRRVNDFCPFCGNQECECNP